MRFFVVVLLVCLTVLVFPAIKPACGQKNKPARQPRSDMSCLAGRPGIPGLHGKPGAPGRDGRDGRPGIQGKQGPRGFDGTPGKQGTPGAPGAPGSRGPLGPKGEAGLKGEKGAPGALGSRGPEGVKGQPGARGLSSYSNWKECSWTKIDYKKDNGLIRDCLFYKNFTDSILHVYWNGDFRIHNCNGCCKRWFFTFNGAECQAPRAIDGTLYMAKGVGHNIHRVRHIEGHCDKIHNGHVRVGFNVGNCAGYGEADAWTGWNSNSRLFVEEVPRPQP